jgi:DNA invertase Pin-like site-specific DNA recombinase
MSVAAYVRVSTTGQDTAQQLDQLSAAGVAPDRGFEDTASGRAGSDRPAWRECLTWLRDGDTLVVVAVDRLGRSVREVAQTLHDLSERGIALRSLREGVDTGTPTGRAVVSIMASIAELEADLGRERRAASRESRIARGLPATRPPKLDAAQEKRLTRLYDSGEPVAELMSLFGVSRRTVFRVVARHRGAAA